MLIDRVCQRSAVRSSTVLEARKLVGLVTIANVLARLARFLESRQGPGTSV